MESKRFYQPRRDRPHDADLCEEQPDGSWRDAAGRLIYRPGRIYKMRTVPAAQGLPGISFTDPTFEEAFANMQRRANRGRR